MRLGVRPRWRVSVSESEPGRVRKTAPQEQAGTRKGREAKRRSLPRSRRIGRLWKLSIRMPRAWIDPRPRKKGVEAWHSASYPKACLTVRRKVSGECRRGRQECLRHVEQGRIVIDLVLLCYKLLMPKDLTREAILGMGYECFCFGLGAISGRNLPLGVRGGASAPADSCSVRLHATALVSSRCGLQPAR